MTNVSRGAAGSVVSTNPFEVDVDSEDETIENEIGLNLTKVLPVSEVKIPAYNPEDISNISLSSETLNVRM